MFESRASNAVDKGVAEVAKRTQPFAVFCTKYTPYMHRTFVKYFITNPNSKKPFCGRTDVRTQGRTDGRKFDAHIIRSTSKFGSRPKQHKTRPKIQHSYLGESDIIHCLVSKAKSKQNVVILTELEEVASLAG